MLVPTSTSPMKGSLTSGGVTSSCRSIVPSSTSVIMPKKRLRCPSMTTYRPTAISSIGVPLSSLTSIPLVSEPPTTTPRRSPCSGISLTV